MEQKPNECDFSLTKVKLTKDGGAAITYQVNSNKVHVECDEYIHPDLRAYFSQLRPLMAQVFALPETLHENIIVTGIGIAGKEENKGCVITAEYITTSGQATKIVTPRIKFQPSYYGFEHKLAIIADCVQKEVFEYLFNGKKAELENCF
jgi:hypothetical protein